jgi:flagellar hook-length control protein FliK
VTHVANIASLQIAPDASAASNAALKAMPSDMSGLFASLLCKSLGDVHASAPDTTAAPQMTSLPVAPQPVTPRGVMQLPIAQQSVMPQPAAPRDIMQLPIGQQSIIPQTDVQPSQIDLSQTDDQQPVVTSTQPAKDITASDIDSALRTQLDALLNSDSAKSGAPADGTKPSVKLIAKNDVPSQPFPLAPNLMQMLAAQQPATDTTDSKTQPDDSASATTTPQASAQTPDIAQLLAAQLSTSAGVTAPANGPAAKSETTQHPPSQRVDLSQLLGAQSGMNAGGTAKPGDAAAKTDAPQEQTASLKAGLVQMLAGQANAQISGDAKNAEKPATSDAAAPKAAVTPSLIQMLAAKLPAQASEQAAKAKQPATATPAAQPEAGKAAASTTKDADQPQKALADATADAKTNVPQQQTVNAKALPIQFGVADPQNGGAQQQQSGSKQQQRQTTQASASDAIDPLKSSPAPQANTAPVQPAAPTPHALTAQPATPASDALAAAQPSAPAQATASHTVATSLHLSRDSDTTPAPNLAALAVNIAAKSKDGEKHFDIRIDPPELGRVEVKLTFDDAGKAQASLTADKQQTLDLMQRDRSTLERALRDAGVDLAGGGLNFSLKGQERDQGNQTPSGRGRNLSVSAITTDSSMPIPGMRTSAADSRLDIRV